MLRLFFLVTCALSIYEDQVGTYDWHKHHIGKILEVQAVPGGRSIVLSSRGILALIKPTGEIDWRRVVSVLDAEVILSVTQAGIVTYSSGVLTMWSILEGQPIWSTLSQPSSQLYLTSTQTQSEVLALLHVASIEFVSLSQGETLSTHPLVNPAKIIGSHNENLLVLGTDNLISQISTKGEIKSFKLSTTAKAHCTKSTCISVENKKASIYMNSEVRDVDWNYGELVSVCDKFFVGKNNLVLEVNDFAVKVVKEIGPAVLAENNQMWVSAEAEGIKVSRLDLDPFFVKSTKSTVKPQKFWSYTNQKGEVLGFLLFEDYSFISFRDSNVRWTREEGLGHLNSVYLMELPSREMHAHNLYFAHVKDHNTWADVFNNFLLRIESQIKAPNFELDLLEKDNFSFKKLILAQSDSGYLFAIQSLTSEIVWRLQVPKALKIIQLNPEEAVLISSSSSNTLLTYICITTGEITKSVTHKFETTNIVFINNEEKLTFLLLNKQQDILPILSDNQEIYYYLVNKDQGTVEGYQQINGVKSKLWGIQMGSSEKIYSFITNRSGKLHQPAIATGASRLIYKYADENLFAVCTQRSGDIFLYIINSISGHIVYRIHQDSVSGEIHMAFHENKLFVHYFNSKFERFEILSIELFKSTVDDSAGEVLKKHYFGSSTEYSSRFTPELTVFTQTYVFPHGIKDMRVTTTAQGITKPSLVMILDTGDVYLLDTVYLSPRRKLEDNQEEGIFDDPSLPTYKPNLPWSPVNIANYYIELEGLSRLETTETRLESTSVVLAYGLDMFLIRVMPEKSFDVLAEDFSKGAIILTIGGLVVLNIAAQKWFKSKNAREKFNT